MKTKLFSFFLSFVIHLLFLISAGDILKFDKKSFSKNQGVASVKIILKRDKTKKIKKNLIAKKSKKSKKSLDKLNKKTKKESAENKVSDFQKQKTKTLGDQSLISKYLSQVRAVILKSKKQSRIAKKLNLKGGVMLSFNMAYPNIVSDIKIVKSSNIKPLDDSALMTLESIDEFPSMPKELSTSIIPVIFEIIYY